MLTRMWSSRKSHSLQGRMENGTATVEDSWAVPYKKTCTLTFIAVLFIIAKTWRNQDVFQ